MSFNRSADKLKDSNNHNSDNDFNNSTSLYLAKQLRLALPYCEPNLHILAHHYFYITRMWKAVQKMLTLAILMSQETTFFAKAAETFTCPIFVLEPPTKGSA
jgi:hypothetical protein